MAGIGMYGWFYAKCKKENGVVVGYIGGIKQAGNAISAQFNPNTPEDNPLYASNRAVENDSSSGSGGTLEAVMDRMTQETAADFFGLTLEDVVVEVGNTPVTGKALKQYGHEQSNPLGVAYIKQHQMDNIRDFHEVVFYSSVTFPMPEDVAQTMGESIEWQTVSLSGTVEGRQGDGTIPWKESIMFPSQEAAMEYIYSRLKEQPAETRAAGKVSV